MLKAMRGYEEVGDDGMMMPDYVPRSKASTVDRDLRSPSDIKALIAAVSEEAAASRASGQLVIETLPPASVMAPDLCRSCGP